MAIILSNTLAELMGIEFQMHKISLHVFDIESLSHTAFL